MDLRPYEKSAIRVCTRDGVCFNGRVELYPAGYGLPSPLEGVPDAFAGGGER